MKVAGISKIVSNDQPEEIGELWQRFYAENVSNKISNKTSDDIVSVYTRYQGDHTQPYTVFIGHEVNEFPISDELDTVEFDTSGHTKYTVTGSLPDVVVKQWSEIWASEKARIYNADYDVYHSDGSVDIYVEYTSS